MEPRVTHSQPAREPTAHGIVNAVAVDVPIARLCADTSPRSGGFDLAHLQALIDSPEPTPPIIAHRDTMTVIDGRHRMRAAEQRGEAMIQVRFFDGTEAEAFRLAVELNVKHGLPLCRADREAAARVLVRTHATWSNRAIGLSAGLPAKMVAGIRRAMASASEPHARIGLDGRVRPVDPSVGRRRAGALLRSRPHASLREIAREAGVSPATVRDVRVRIESGQDLPPAVQAAPVNPVAPEPLKILCELQRDPTLRLTSTGRWLLRRLSSQMISTDDATAIAGTIPPHCRGLIADFMRSCAERWSTLADELEQRCE
ncbi:ParB/RepB/Spo0J family partition protein [Pseudonocardia sp. ICBG162]|uniref:ParB/RepB/Spo0J family partition protein n=1 Tax=Pseudonocardia sp. ICBG162 TaxID=2846761 RepID=UPI001CF62BFB